VQPQVDEIKHSQTSDPFAFRLQKAGGGTLTGVDIYWDDASGGNTFGGCPVANSNPVTWPNNCDAGILRVEVTDLTNTYVYFVYPNATGTKNTLTAGTNPTGTAISTGCTGAPTPNKCGFTLNLGILSSPAYARVSSIYKDYQLTVESTNSGDKFVGAQVIVDATGKAADVVRRIQVRYSQDALGGPLSALQGGTSICKKFTINGITATDSGGCWPNPSYGSTANPAQPLP
jgi:hypothetical protein